MWACFEFVHAFFGANLSLFELAWNHVKITFKVSLPSKKLSRAFTAELTCWCARKWRTRCPSESAFCLSSSWLQTCGGDGPKRAPFSHPHRRPLRPRLLVRQFHFGWDYFCCELVCAKTVICGNGFLCKKYGISFGQTKRRVKKSKKEFLN